MSDSKTIDDGGFAFPSEPDADACGMTRRDYFAGQALASYLANPEGWRAKPDIIARDCYAIADAFIARGKAGAA